MNIYAGCYNNPFLIWGKCRNKWLRTILPMPFQFHHTQMDGITAAEFLERLPQPGMRKFTEQRSGLGREIQERLEAAVQAGLSREGEGGKEITALHRRWLTITGKRYDPAKHRGIAELYVMDERFTAYYDKYLPGCARFLRDVVAYWAK